MSQVWQRTNKFGKTESSTVTAVTVKRLFEAAGVSANTKDRQVVWLHNTDDTNEIWYKKRIATDVTALSLSKTTKHGRVLPGESVPFTISEAIDILILSATGTISYVAWEEM